MPAKLVIAHVRCARCSANVPLTGVTAPATCAACGWSDALPLASWRWVLEPGVRAAAPGDTVLGHTRESALLCAGCKTAIDEHAIARAFAARKAFVACTRCSVPMPMRRLTDDCAEMGDGQTRPRERIDLPCSNCGAQLSIDGSTQAPVCTFCGTRNAVAPEIWARFSPQRGLAQPFHVWTRSSRPKTPKWPFFAAAAGVAAIVGLVVVVVHAMKPPSPFGAIGGRCSGTQSACTHDGKSYLECENDKFVVALTCKGPKGCRPTEHGKSVSCDYTRADEGDPCDVKDYACATDGKSELRCDGSKFVASSSCLGPDGCTLAPKKDGYTLTCDDHVAPPNSPCSEDGRFACSTDKKSMLRCTRGHFVLASTCKGPRACSLSKNRVDDTTTVSCDGNVADVGDPCEPNHHACDTDGKSMLACESGRFVVARRCAGGCAAVEDHIQCRSR